MSMLVLPTGRNFSFENILKALFHLWSPFSLIPPFSSVKLQGSVELHSCAYPQKASSYLDHSIRNKNDRSRHCSPNRINSPEKVAILMKKKERWHSCTICSLQSCLTCQILLSVSHPKSQHFFLFVLWHCPKQHFCAFSTSYTYKVYK